MVNVKPKLSTIELSADCPTHSRTEICVRDTATVVDEPEARGGTNRGPSPTETLIASVLGCTNVVLNKVAAANGVKIGALKLKAQAAFDSRGPQLIAEVPVPFPTLDLTVDITCDADAATLEKLKDGLHRFCPLHTVMAAAGTEVRETWNVTQA